MDIRKMSLFAESAKNVSAISKSAFALPPERLQILEERLPQLYHMEYWDPEYQAWKPFLDVYFKCGVNPELTVKWGSPLMEKEDYLLPPESPRHNIFVEILKLRNTTGTVIFEDYQYQEIAQLCTNEVAYIMQNKKSIVQQLHNPSLYITTIQQLLASGTWRGLLCAIYLYRHCQSDYVVWPTEVTAELAGRLKQWTETYLTTFDYMVDFLDGNPVYDWYAPTTRNVVERTWTSALIINGRPRLLTPADISNCSPILKDALISYIGSCPVVYDDPFKTITIWDSLCNLLFAGDMATRPDFIERAFYAMCIPNTYVSKLCNVLYDFYWIIQDCSLTGLLYDRKITAYSNGEGLDMTPEMYLQSLYLRGFPERTQ